MEYSKLGTTNLNISRIGCGCWAISGHGYGHVDDAESINAIRKALDEGINFFDTADVYGFGHSEEILSKALGAERKKVVIATKFGVCWDADGKTYKDCSPKSIHEAIEGSLRRLRIDCIPLYQIHWYDHVTPIPEIMNTLKKYQEAGKIMHIGCSNFSAELIKEALRVHRLDSLQTLFNIIERDSEADIIRSRAEWDIGIIAYGVLARGLLSGKYVSERKFCGNDTRQKDKNFQGEQFKQNLKVIEELTRISKRYDKHPSQVAIRWVLEHKNITCALVGAKNSQQVENNSRVFDWVLSAEDFNLISALTKFAAPQPQW